MQANSKWLELGWRHPLWNIIRFYLSIRGKKQQETWQKALKNKKAIQIGDGQELPVPTAHIDLLFEYLDVREEMFNIASRQLRNEDAALQYCVDKKITVGKTTTKSKDHHQASKAMIGAVSGIARRVCHKHNIPLDDDPQKRCIWCKDEELQVTARNLDGAVPGLVNPYAIWEIKEYWGKTQGGSKMSDAVYECQLVGYELLDYTARSGQNIHHIVFLDGKDQWSYRKSDLKRFIDLLNQGLIDHLIIGDEVESGWEPLLESIIAEQSIN